MAASSSSSSSTPLPAPAVSSPATPLPPEASSSSSSSSSSSYGAVGGPLIDAPPAPTSIRPAAGANTATAASSAAKKVKEVKQPEHPQQLPSLDIQGVIQLIRDKPNAKIVFMTGAGISVSCGIPDFRTPGTGLYDNLAKYKLPTPTAVFDIGYFRKEPKAFCMLAKELYPSQYRPSPLHYLMMIIKKRGQLLRCFTQNIDGLERQAGLVDDDLVEAHGSFATAHCTGCHTAYPAEYVRSAIFSDRIPECSKKECKSSVKPDITFFGESLPQRFHDRSKVDMPAADLLIVCGTSLKVQPFAGLINQVSATCPRLLINREQVGMRVERRVRSNDMFGFLDDIQGGGGEGGFRFGASDNYRDAFAQMDCDTAAWTIADALGERAALQALIDAGPVATSIFAAPPPATTKASRSCTIQ